MIKDQLMLQKHFMILKNLDKYYGNEFKKNKLMLIQG